MKKLCLILMAALLCFGMVACGSDNTDTPAGDDTPTLKTVKFNVGFDPETFDPQASDNLENSMVVTQMYDTLYRENVNGEFEPSLATGYTLSDDGLVYTFTLRDGLTFADGTPLTAEDVAFSWTRALDPVNAFPYSYQLYYIKNGAAFNEGTATAADLGLEVVDEKTLVVTLEAPTPYFVSLTGFTTYGIVSKAFVEKQETYGVDAASSLASGPFTIAEWNQGQYVKFVKNENYWDAENVHLDELYMYAVGESSTEIQMYETEQLDITYKTMSPADQTRLGAEGLLKEWASLMTSYITVNTELEPLNDVRVRNALLLALNRKQIAEAVIMNAEAVTGFVPNGYTAVDDPSKLFRNETLIPAEGDVAKAQQLLADAGYPNGEGFPTDFELLYTSNESNKALCEAIVEMWRVNLGITVVASPLDGTTRAERRKNGDFAFSNDGWSTDYLDPFSFLELGITGNIYNFAKYSNADYDALMDIVKNTSDQTVRQEKMVAAEKIYVADAPVLPLANSKKLYMQKDNIKNVVRSLLGQIDFKWTDVE